MKKLNSVSLNFNLREPHAKRPTQLYCVVRVDGKQYKIPLGVKLEPWLWDARRQQPVQTIENENILHIIKIILGLKLGFLEKVCYGCSKDIILELKREIGNMANEQNLQRKVTRTPKATTLLKRAFELYYLENKRKDSTVRETKKRLNCYFEYCLEIGKDKMSMLSRNGLNEYCDYLVRQRDELEKQGCKVRSSNTRINAKCELMARLINYMVGHAAFAKYKIQPVKYRQLQEFKAKGEHKMRRPLTEDEVKAIAECVGLTAREREYRDLFITQCECGCRASDLWKVFDKTQQEHYAYNGKEAIVINTQKEDIKAVIMLTPLIKLTQNKYEHGWRINVRGKVSVYNKALKHIFCKAGLDNMEQYTDAYGVTQNKPLYEVINSHFARYTFVRACIDKGLTPHEIKDLTGHASEAMINEVYAVITAKDKAANAFKALERVSDKLQNNDTNGQQSSLQSTAQAEILHLRNILAFFRVRI